MAKWSDKTRKLQAEANDTIEQLLRSMHDDRVERGDYEHVEPAERHKYDLDRQGMNGFVVVGQFQSFEDIDVTNEVIGFDPSTTPATLRGLLHFALERM
jgi:hypothetical protein